MSELPNPLTPADCDLRGYRWMPLDVVRVIDSDTFGLSTGDEFKTAFRLWAKSWMQVPAASLPDDDRLLAHLAGLSENMPKWKKVRAVALRGWIKCSDDRLYHPVIAEKALEAMGKREDHAEQQENIQSRQQRLRERRKAMFEQLREHGIVPAWDAKTSELERLIESLGSPQPVTPPVTPETKNVTGDVPGDVTGDAPATAKTRTLPDRTVNLKTVGTVVAPGKPSRSESDDFTPRNEADWQRYFADHHGVLLNERSVHDRKKAWPLFSAWTKAGVTARQMDAAVAKAQADATEPIAFLPAYVDRVIASMAAPAPVDTRSESRRTAYEVLTGKGQAHEPSYGDAIDVDAKLIG